MRKKVIKGGKEAIGVSLLVTVCFLILLAAIAFVAYTIMSTEQLRLDNAVERAYNSVILALQRTGSSLDKAMDDEHVTGFGYYTYMGTAIYIWGDAYIRLPVTSFPDISSIRSVISSYDSETGRLECVRYASGIEIVPDNLFSRGSPALEFPDIIYLSLDAKPFMDSMNRTLGMAVLAGVVLIVIYLLVLYTLRQNTKYREQLREQESLVRLGQAARTLAHEIKNPLSAITLEIAILKRSVSSQLLDDVLVIEHETKRLKQLTDKVSDFLRNPRGTPQRLDLVKAVEDLLPLFPEGVRLAPNTTSGIYVSFDPDRFRSVLENLLKNAVEASEGEEVDVTVEVFRETKHSCKLLVSDRGCGLDKGSEDRLFDPFYTTKIHGSGIGLAISKEFVEAAGGRIELRPREGKGTVADVTLPLFGKKLSERPGRMK